MYQFVASNGTLNTMAQVTAATGSAAQITTTKLMAGVSPPPPAKQGVIVQALSTNSASCWVGDSNTAVNRGLELVPGASVTIPVQDPSVIWAISGSSGQKLNVVWC